MGFLKAIGTRIGVFLGVSLGVLLGSTTAFAEPVFYGTDTNVVWTSLGTIDYNNLDACFRGNVSCNATTDGRWRAYPQRSNGMLTGDMYNGCYRYQGRALNRYSDLNSSGGCTCPGGAADCSKESLVRVFVGYQTFCPVGSPNPCPTGGEVRVNCSIQTFSIGEGATQIGSYNQNCIEGRPLRLSRATTVVSTTPSPGCPAGQGLDGGACVPCPSGTYKEFAGDFACSPCPAAAIPGASGLTYQTSPAPGATDITNCSASYSCPTGYTQGTEPVSYSSSNGYAGAHCTAPAPSPTPTPSGCPYDPAMAITVQSSTPPTTATSNDGQIVFRLANNVGTLTSTHWQIPAQGTWTVSGTDGNILTGTGLDEGNFTTNATDPANTLCTATAPTVNLAVAPCDPVAQAASTSNYIQCTYSCSGGGTANVRISSGTCSDMAPKMRAQSQAPNCAIATPASCANVPAQVNGCTNSLCPGGPQGSTLHIVWDLAGRIDYLASVPGVHSGVCGTVDGNTAYFVCSISGQQPYNQFSAKFGSCTSLSGIQFSGTKTKTGAPWFGNAYCAW